MGSEFTTESDVMTTVVVVVEEEAQGRVDKLKNLLAAARNFVFNDSIEGPLVALSSN